MRDYMLPKEKIAGKIKGVRKKGDRYNLPSAERSQPPFFLQRKIGAFNCFGGLV